ncbi:hypothetical protein PB2503_07774 [Parvularcula bermudensis HTCC2503]|uniref:Uncharacterized protein n=1 Tax=Parvularcula bermudensis (strain ATCC BAA-594 / HTCC2503 / KCTC 12087) TaxID=314260 RepID=E0TGJ1_PARBH|nr:hypothetical protein PB2503_07774 [Parvularcula bermudensis HTCC2503]
MVAKEAARRAGMTLGEWMTSMINEVGNEAGATSGTSGSVPTGVSPEQLRAVVDSLNRLNERLKNTEDQVKKSDERSREAAQGLNTAVETVFERLKRIERERAEGGAPAPEAQAATAPRESDRERIEILKSLEIALSGMIEQFEATRDEALSRVQQNEAAVRQLETRVSQLDSRLTRGFEEVYIALDSIDGQLDDAEAAARAVLTEAQAASESSDAEFIERTGRKLQLLGNEIKRSGDQIAAVEKMVISLATEIEAAEERSAKGISDISRDLDDIREELSEFGVNAQELAAAKTDASGSSIEALQRSYDEIVARLNDPDAASAPLTARREPSHSQALTDDDRDFDEVLGEGPMASPAESAEEAGSPEESAKAQEKILQAAKLRQERLEKERQSFVDEAPGQAAPTPNGPATPRVNFDEVSDNVEPRAPGRRFASFSLLSILGVVVVATIAIAALFLRGGDTSPTPPTTEPVIAANDPSTADPTPPPPVQEGPSDLAVRLYTESKQLLSGQPTEAEKAQAAQYLSRAADEGYAPATYRLGELYFEGEGVPQDLSAALSAFQSAARAGNVPAMHRLGTLAIEPSVNGQNVEEALTWFERAAAFGYVDSIYNLGYLFDPTTEGYLPEDLRDAEQSYFWYRIAQRLGDSIAAQDAQAVGQALSAETLASLDDRVANWRPRVADVQANDRYQALNGN